MIKLIDIIETHIKDCKSRTEDPTQQTLTKDAIEIQVLTDILDDYKEQVSCNGCDYKKYKNKLGAIAGSICTKCNRHIDINVIDHYKEDNKVVELSDAPLSCD